MVLYYNTQHAMFAPRNNPSAQSTPFNYSQPFNYSTNGSTAGHTFVTNAMPADLSCATMDSSYQQNVNMPWPYTVSPPIPPSSAGCPRPSPVPSSYEDWVQSQGSPLPSPTGHVTMTQSQVAGQAFTYGPPLHHCRVHNGSPVLEFPGTSITGHVTLHDFGHHQAEGHPSPDSAQAVSSDGLSGSESPGPAAMNQGSVPIRPQPARSPFEWMKKSSYQSIPNPGKTRTKDKYRVVYTDHQRLELEKEFHYSRYITIRRKSEIASMLGLSERQVKIWFQNRRAKERKQAKKAEELMQKTKDQLHPGLHIPNNITISSVYKPIISLEEVHS